MEYDIRKYLRYIAILEDSMATRDLLPELLQLARPPELAEVFTIYDSLEDALASVDKLVN